MNKDEEKELIAGLATSRDELQERLHEARQKRMELRLANRDKLREFQQKLGELSFVFGAAITPVVVVARKDEHINHAGFLLGGVALYLLIGFIALWRTKNILEQDADDAPHVGLMEEIVTYPLIDAHNKMLYDIQNKDYQKEYFAARDAAIERLTGEDDYKVKANFTGDIILSLFVAASLLTARTVWPYEEWLYWEVFLLALCGAALLTLISYKRTRKNQLLLAGKRKQLAKIRKAYRDWESSVLKGDR